jgi:DNA-binding transcriptional LysR family regulator
MPLDLRRAATFHAVARSGGIAAAARLEGRSPPAIHAELRRFERDAGVALTERVGRRLRLTPEGRVLFAAVDRALAEVERASRSVRAGGAAEVPLRIGCVTAFCRYRFAPALFGAASRDRSIQLRTDSHDNLLEALLGGEIDFAITYRPMIAAPIESRVVSEERLWLVGAVEGEPTPETLASEPCVAYEEYEYVFARWFQEAFGRQAAALRPIDHTSELEEALLAVAAGRGFTIAPAEAARAFGLSSTGPEVVNELTLCAVGGRLRSADAVWLNELLAVRG